MPARMLGTPSACLLLLCLQLLAMSGQFAMPVAATDDELKKLQAHSQLFDVKSSQQETDLERVKAAIENVASGADLMAKLLGEESVFVDLYKPKADLAKKLLEACKMDKSNCDQTFTRIKEVRNGLDKRLVSLRLFVDKCDEQLKKICPRSQKSWGTFKFLL
jgi:hypothetical protein